MAASSSSGPDLGASQSAFLAAGLKPLSARDAHLRSKALDANRKCALKKWVTLVSLDFNAWGVAKQAMGPFDPKFATGGLVESVQDCLADKATATLHQRVGPIFRYVHFWKLQFVVCLPVREHQLYDYFKANPNAAPTSFRSLLIAFSFAKHLLGLIVLDEALSSGRIVGLANAHYSTRCAVKRRPALTVEQVKRLEALVLSPMARPMDRIAAGCFLLMIYGRLRFSDMQRSSGFAIDSALIDGVESGYLEGQAERTKTSVSLERKIRSLPIAAGGQDFRLRSQVEACRPALVALWVTTCNRRDCDEIAAGRFKPDLTRSGMIANLADPQLPPENEEEADAISSSSSEASDDEEEAPVSDEEQALEQIAGQWGPEPGDGPWARHKQTRFLHKVRDEARAKDIGVSDESFAKLEAEGLTTMATFAFCCHFNPSATDEKPLTDLVTKVLGAAPSLKEMSCFRRLFAEAYATVASDIRSQVEATEDSSIKKLAPADRAERLREQQSRLKGLDLRGNMEPGDSLIDRAVAIYESDRLQYVEWQHSVSRQHELLTGLKKDASLTLDSAGGLKIASKPNVTPCDVSTDMMVRYALVRRGLAFEQANILAYHLHDELLEKYMSFRLMDPPPNHARVSLKQIEQADRQFTMLLAEHTRGGIKVKAGGSRPCDGVKEDCTCAQSKDAIEGGHIFVVHPEGPDQTFYEDASWAPDLFWLRLPWVSTDSAPLTQPSPAFPSAELPADGPLVIELCAGSAILSQTAASRGFAIMPVDHAHNRHTPKCKMVNLDLTQSHSSEVLKFVIKSRRVAMVFAAPPCGTCSAARHFRPGPPVLRTTSHPWGVPWASTRDCVKLKAANALYKQLCAFLELCDQHSVPWCVENPTNSTFWELPCFAYPLAHGFFAHCQACAFGSERDKKTSFLCSSSGISRMALMCPGCKQHATWGLTSDDTFATAEEAAYPPAMCQALCDVFESEAARLNYVLGSAQPLLARAHKQPRGRLHPQLLSEHAAVLSRLLPRPPPLNHKRCLTQDVHGVPAGSKLLRSENRGNKGLFCVFGVFRSPESFVREAKLLYHPFDSLAQLPDYLIKSLFEQLTKSPAEICKLRLLRLQKWRARATELAPVEHAHRAKMQPSVKEILANKRTALLEEMAAEIDWPDKGLFSEMRQGFRLVGCLSPSGVFREGGYLASISESELMENADSIRASLLARVSADPLDENAEELYDVTLQEATQKKWLDGPMTPGDIGKRFEAWIPVRRFCVVQKGRLRPIDDFKENLVNQACSTSERIVLQAMDHLLWSLSVLCHFYRKRGAVDFTLSSGERLTGLVHPDWQKPGASMQVATLDLKSAYKQLPLNPCDFDKSVVTLKDPKTGSISCFVMRTLPFGALASVYHFLRVSLLLHALGCHLGACWSAYFDDFPMATHSLVATSTSALVKGFLKLAGFDFAEEKCTPFSSDVEVLGVTLDVSQSSEGLINIRNKPSRCEELNAVIEEVLRDKALVPCRLPSFIGKLQFADGQIWGRAGRMAMHDLRSLGFTSRIPVSLDASGIEALKILQQRLTHGKPRVIRAGWKEKPILLFTDGALEDDNLDHGPATVGAVMFKPNEPNVHAFGCEVPANVLSHWRSDGKKHVIGLVELYGAILALRHWRKHLDGSRVILFVDNWPALDTLVKGDASVAIWREILMILENPQEASPCYLWIARVPSASNIADAPSRGSLSELSARLNRARHDELWLISYAGPRGLCITGCAVRPSREEVQQLLEKEVAPPDVRPIAEASWSRDLEPGWHEAGTAFLEGDSAEYSHCDGLPRNGSHVINKTRLFSTNCTWHGQPGLQVTLKEPLTFQGNLVLTGEIQIMGEQELEGPCISVSGKMTVIAANASFVGCRNRMQAGTFQTNPEHVKPCTYEAQASNSPTVNTALLGPQPQEPKASKLGRQPSLLSRQSSQTRFANKGIEPCSHAKRSRNLGVQLAGQPGFCFLCVVKTECRSPILSFRRSHRQTQNREDVKCISRC
ncbi:unnamed protein product [Symbiodinium sp. CCMP2592]|nr:unnamed protein product [Symbiodinium sp. CCMP2592]